ncbi:MAG: MATE family efflux transporter, partial [Lentisphaeria bacterium]|nr:MATE family efflux transporter [Lentisphaeria bacterium]
MNMCRGPLRKQIITFAVPLVFTGLLQIFFHAADLMVVGRFASYRALAAVGSTGSLTMLIINVFLGISIGTNVLVARYLGEKNRKEVSRTVHTAIFAALFGGVVLGIFGIVMSKTFLQMMSTPDDVIDMATLYMRIYFAGMPVVLLYNFGSSVMRAAGDTKRPFYFLVTGGIINVILNLFFVLCCGMDVSGVALATIISQAVSAGMILRSLMHMGEGCRFVWKKLKISWKNLREMLWLGVPAGFQSSCFSLANILIQSSLNSFGSEVMAGSAAAVQWEGFLFVSSTALGHTMVSFVGQNLGGKQYKRIRESIRYGMIFAIILTLVISGIILLFREPLLAMFNKNPEVIKWGVVRFLISLPMQWACSVMEIETSALRGLGCSIGPTLIMIFGICVFRIVWLWTMFRAVPTYAVLVWSFPITRLI